MEEEFEYEYEVLEVGEDHVEVLYKAEGHPDIIIGVHRPFEDEDWEKVVEAYAPIWEWANRQKVRKEIVKGVKQKKAKRVLANTFKEKTRAIRPIQRLE